MMNKVTMTDLTKQPAYREAILTVLRYELRDGLTIEEAAERHSVPVEFAKKATKAKRLRRKVAVTSANDEALRLAIELTARVNVLEKTVYELIDLAQPGVASR